ncbi:MAG: type II toxin-antitoxin system VapC family toxin [Actinomycetota bacterium]|nr:type II toxin-antitoxin system VapC family toxin [Actinomycetota bacterium]MDQ2852603.1 type II toxin-antitoxin system VapC family toxin [Actinomycetota bacterium]
MIYLDTSVALKAVLAEPESPTVLTWMRERIDAAEIIVSSRLLRTEMYRVAYREDLPTDQVDLILDKVNLIDLDRLIVDAAAAINHHVKTLDAIHLATAVQLIEDGIVLCTHDRAKADVGERLGLTVLGPTGLGQAQPATP